MSRPVASPSFSADAPPKSRSGLLLLGERFPSFLLVVLAVGLCLACTARAETLPPPPARYFNDYAGVVDGGTANRLNAELEQFERDSSDQILVAVFRRMESRSSVEDYTVRVAQSWKVGQKGRNNGAVLFVFLQEHQVYIQVGYGLEPVLPDALCFQIIEREIKPRFRANDFGGGLRAGVHAMMAATRGEYHGTGRTINQTNHRAGRSGSSLFPVLMFFVFILAAGALSRRRVRTFGRHRTPWGGGFGPGSFGGGFGGFGGGSSGSGGGFSGGGGSFGGGGAGGKW